MSDLAYEYNEVIAMLEYIGDEYKEDKYYRMARQVEEAYAKAKAFDEIVEVFKKVTIYNTATALEVKEILDNLEDTNNEQTKHQIIIRQRNCTN